MPGRISDEDIQKVREATDLVAFIGETTPVRQRGRDFWCCCPLHQEKTPSFKIDPATQLWHCFGCGEGGDVFGYVMKTEDLSFPDAVRRLAERAHIDIAETQGGKGVSSSQKQRLKDVCAQAAEFFHTQLMRGKTDGAAQARSYLAGRNLGGTVPRKWNLGYAPGRGALVRYLRGKGFSTTDMVDANVALVGKDGKLRDRFYDRVMFPIRDVSGETIAFGGRIMGDGQPKYLNSQETPVFRKSQVLFGLDFAKASMTTTGVAVVVEGYTDVIACHEAGLTNVVATLGTALTRQHIRVLSRHAKNAIVYLFDGDAAGQRAADRALQFIDASMTPEGARKPIALKAVTLPDNLDPAEFIEQRGVDQLRQIIASAKDLLRYGIERRLAAHDLSRPEGRSAAMNDALQVLAPIKGSLLAQQYAVEIASMTRARESDALDALERLRPVAAAAEEVPARPVAARPQTTDRALSAEEQSRRKFERQLLGLVAQNPLLGLAHADALAATQWHDSANALVAQALLDKLIEDPASTPAALVTAASRKVPAAGGFLTTVSADAHMDASRLAAYLCEELAIGDGEDAIATLKAQLRDPQAVSPEEYDTLFETVVALQKDLETRKANHKPL
ncbi:MAG: DNA primase [Coriobacteriia bacterium]|nr:DNA primase [Coriobacteriia bacterium]